MQYIKSQVKKNNIMYGSKPKEIGVYELNTKEMFFYQYLPIKIKHSRIIKEKRLDIFNKLIHECVMDYKKDFGLEDFKEKYIYLTAKSLYQTKGCSFNRKGFHSDGFMTNDINYIWCDYTPTTFNFSDFKLTLDDEISLLEMDLQAIPSKDYKYSENQLLRLNQYNIHKVTEDLNFNGIRTFFKLSFSNDRYDLIGNSHNYELNYDWEMKQRKLNRNMPQSILKK